MEDIWLPKLAPLHRSSCLSLARGLVSEPDCWEVSSNPPLHVLKDIEEDKSILNPTQMRLESGFVIFYIFSNFPGVLSYQLNITLLLLFHSQYLLRETGGFVYCQVSNQTKQVIISV